MDGKDGLEASPASVDGTVGGVSGALEGLPVTWAARTGRPGTGLGGARFQAKAYAAALLCRDRCSPAPGSRGGSA